MRKGIVATALLLMAATAGAGTIDFDSVALGSVSSVNSGDNTVTFGGPGGSTPLPVSTGPQQLPGSEGLCCEETSQCQTTIFERPFRKLACYPLGSHIGLIGDLPMVNSIDRP